MLVSATGILSAHNHHIKSLKTNDNGSVDSFQPSGYFLFFILGIVILFFVWWVYCMIEFTFVPEYYKLIVLAVGFLLDPAAGVLAAYILKK